MLAARRACGCLAAACLQPYSRNYFRMIRVAVDEGLHIESATRATVERGPWGCARCRAAEAPAGEGDPAPGTPS